MQKTRNLVWLAIAVLVQLPWIILALTGIGHEMLAEHPARVSVLAGLTIIAAAFVLTWAAEVAERDIPRSLVLIVIALISVLPEYAVDLHFAWRAGKEHAYKAYAVANMTGANRLLIGVGWALVAIVFYFKYKKQEIPLDRSQGLELSLLLLATLYSFLIPLKGTLSLIDVFVFFAMFLYYAARASRGEGHDEPLEGVAGAIDSMLGPRARRGVIVLMFLFAGYAIWLSAEPFAEGLVASGKRYGIDEFLLVQWLAPLASESPEVVIALLFALKGRSSTSIGALISSKVNQWTLLVGAIPLVYAISAGSLIGMDLDSRQREELLLTSAQSLFAAVILSDFQFSLKEAMVLFFLFVAQFFFPQESVRYAFSALYVLLAIGLLIWSQPRRQTLWRALLLRS
jgi:cation:H+ antiporter